MRRFLITSRNFIGTVELVYNNDILHTISFADADITPEQRKNFKAAVPVSFNDLGPFTQTYKLVTVESEYQISFDDFWNKYKKKVNKARCIPIWNKMTAPERVAAYNFIVKYNRFCERDGRGRLDPENYLKRSTWENEY